MELKNEDFNLYQQKINEKWDDTDEIKYVQLERNKIKNVITAAAKESLCEKKRKKKSG